MRVLSADWVLPVEGAPIENGAVAIEDGRIAAVGTIDDLGAGDHFAEAAIVPGIVNAHSHLEYAVYAGFGDGLSFAPWLATHIERKARIDRPQMEAIARLGAAQCLASGITTVGDAAFTGATAHACAELGLRAIVYLEVFGRDAAEAMQQFEEKTAYVASALSDRVRLGVSPHAPYTCSSEVYAACLALDVPVMTHFNESQDELDWLLRGEGPMKPVEPLLIDPDGQSGIRRLAAAGLLDPRIVAAHCVKVDAEEIGMLARHDVAVVHCPRSNGLLGCGIAPLAELRAAGSSSRHRHRRRLVRALARRVRGAARGDLGSRAPGANAPTHFPRPRRSNWPRWAALGPSASRPRSARSSPASARISQFSPSRALRIYHGRIRRPPSCTAAPLSASWLPSSTARHGTREEDSNGTS